MVESDPHSGFRFPVGDRARIWTLMAVGRFAPSPSGPLHLGSLRTAMVAWLFARSAGSPFLLRIEDIDAASARVAHEESQRRDLEALGVDWDGDVLHQADRIDRYRTVLSRLIDDGLVYRCYCTRREVLEAAVAPHEHLPEGAYPGTCIDLTSAQRQEREDAGRSPALRLRAEGALVAFDDGLHGRVEGVVDDFVVCRNDGTPSYNLAVVVDDEEQGIEEVVRGDDLLLGTPRQVHLGGLLGYRPLRYAHVPLVLGPDGVRLAKRHGAVTLADQRAEGRDATGVRSVLATSLGLAEPGEPVSMDDLLARFDPTTLPREPWILVDP